MEPAPASTRRELSRQPLGRQIAGILRNEILVGNIKPHTHLTQSEVCAQFRTSRMPVRDALLQLTRDGLVTEEGAGRVRVAEFTSRDLRESYMLQGILHGIAAERVAERASAAELDDLDALHGATRDAVAASDFELVDTLVWRFHRYVNRLAYSANIRAMIRPILTTIPTNYFQLMPQWAPVRVSTQGDLLEAFRAHDGSTARRVIVEHLQVTGDALLEHLRQRGAIVD